MKGRCSHCGAHTNRTYRKNDNVDEGGVAKESLIHRNKRSVDSFCQTPDKLMNFVEKDSELCSKVQPHVKFQLLIPE